jgi:hypothetical protein
VLASDPVDLQLSERLLRERLHALGPAPRAELLHVLMPPDFECVDRIGERLERMELLLENLQSGDKRTDYPPVTSGAPEPATDGDAGGLAE